MQSTEQRVVRRRTLVLLCVAAFGFSLWHAAGMVSDHLTGGTATGACFMLTLMTGITELLLVLAVMVSAGGWGHLAIGWLMRRGVARGTGETPAPRLVTPGLVAVTSILAGYWLLAVAMMAAGSLIPGGLSRYVWWPVVGVGVGLAVFQGRRRLDALTLPSFFDGRFLHWLVLALAVGVWVAGAAMPPGMGIDGDGYDVLLYHLQLPREYLVNQQVSGLEHNVYSHYPLGQEMLYLLMMILRGGPYTGMYAAQFSHGIMAVLAAAAIFSALRPSDDRRARYAMLLLGTTPMVLYLSWLAFAELSEVLSLTLSLLWLRVWILSGGGSFFYHRGTEDSEKAEADSQSSVAVFPPIRAALLVGLCLGVACCAKYLSVGLIVLPVLVVMLGLAIARAGRRSISAGLLHVLLAGVVALAVFSPWLIRNAVEVGNPVFPLATEWFGKGHWTDEQQLRWNAGHAPGDHPPVPVPPDYQPGPPSNRLAMLYHNFIVNGLFGQITVLLFLVALGELISRGRRGEAWDWALLVVAGVLLAVWALATSGMPGRFAVPVVVPMALLAAGFLSRLARIPTNPLRRNATPTPSGLPWGLAPAAVLLAMAMFVNLSTVSLSFGGYYGVFAQSLRSALGVPGTPGQDLTIAASLTRELKYRGVKDEFPANAPFLLVGGTPFYYADSSLYATPFNTPPLLTLAGDGTPTERIERLRQAGVQYIGVDWRDLRRVARSYGLPEPLVANMYNRQAAGRPPELRPLEELAPLGVMELQEFHAPPPRQLLVPDTDGNLLPWPDYTLYATPWAPRTTWPEPAATQPGQ